MPNKMPNAAKAIYSFLTVILLGGIWFLVREKSVPVELAQIKRSSFQENLRVDGVIKSKIKVTVAAYATGDLGRVDLKVGDEVKKGQPISLLSWDVKKNIVSPIDGVISKVYRESAGPILRGEPIVDVIDPHSLEIVSEVLTTEAVRIPLGALVQVTGVGSSEFITGKVSKISQAGFVKLSALGIEEEKTEVTMTFNSPPKTRLGDNFHVELLIQISKQENVLTVPLGALFKDKDDWAVYSVENHKAHLRKIKIGNKNELEAVVLDGLAEADKVIMFPGDQIKEGTKID